MISPSSSTTLLNDTIQVVQLARETALAKGYSEQAERLSPVLNDLKRVVEIASAPPRPSSVPETMARNDFRTLLSTIQTSQSQETNTTNNSQPPADKSKVVVAMAAGGMPEVDIARQMGMTRDEVRMLLQIDNNKNNSTGGFRI